MYALAFGIPPDLVGALSSLLVLVLAFVPGFGLAWGLGRRGDWDLPAILCASFAFEVAGVGVLALAAYYIGLSLMAVIGATGVLAVVGWVWGLRLARGTDRPAPGWSALALGGVSLVLGVWQRPWYAQSSDTFYHLAAVRSLVATGRPLVTDPLYGTSLTVLDPTSGVWHTVLAAWARLTGLDIMAWLWPGASAVGGALTIVGFWSLAKAVGRTERVATWATVAFLVFGVGLDMRWYAYPNRLSLGMAFIALFAVVSLTLKRTWAAAALAVAAGWATIAMHLATAEMAMGAAGVLLLLQLAAMVAARRRTGVWEWRTPAAVFGAGAVVALLAVPLLLPKAAVVRGSGLVRYAADYLEPDIVRLPLGMAIVRPGSMLETNSWSLLFSPWAILVTTTVALVAAFLAFRRGDARALAATAICGLPAALLLDPPITTMMLSFSPYLVSRVAILLPFTAYVGVAWALGVYTSEEGRWRTVGLALAAIALLAAAMEGARGLAATYYPGRDYSVWASRALDVRRIYGQDGLYQAWRIVGTSYPVVASDIGTSYYMIGLLPVATVGVPVKHAPFAIEERDGEERREAMVTLTTTSTPEPVRREILDRWDAGYVLLNVRDVRRKSTYESFRAQPGTFEQVVGTPELALFRVRR
jgi:hypothetical protein